MFITTECSFDCQNCNEQIDRLRELAGLSERNIDYNLDQKYQQFNQKFFRNNLPSIPIKWNKSKRVGGVVKAEVTRYKDGSEKLKPNSITMEISDLFKRSEQDLDAIMLHEMIHVFFYHNGHLREHHGSKFRLVADQIGKVVGYKIPLTDEVGDFELTDDSKTKPVAVLVFHKNSGGQVFALFTPKFAKEKLDIFKKLWGGMVEDKAALGAELIVVNNPTWTKVSAQYPIVRSFDKMFKPMDPKVFDDLEGEVLFKFGKTLENAIIQEDKITEANIIGSGIHIKEIPDDIRKNHKLIGKGTTSLVFEKDDSTVIIFTRDKIKEEWFRTSGIGKRIGEYESKGHPNHNIRVMPIYIFEVEKLFPLDPENKKKVKQMIKILDDERMKHYKKDRSYFFNAVLYDLDLDFTSHKSLEEFLNFIQNYGDEQYSFDFLLRNFMQNKEGEIIANDLVVDNELRDAIMKQKMSRY